MHYSVKDGCFNEERRRRETLLSGPKVWVSTHVAIVFGGNHGKVKVLTCVLIIRAFCWERGLMLPEQWQVGGRPN